MKITSERASSLVDLACVIKANLNYQIGYTHPCGSFTNPEDDFVLFDIVSKSDAHLLGITRTQFEPMLIAREDLERHEHGIFTEEFPNDYCLHDDRVRAFLEEVDQALLDGKIFFDPEIERKVGNATFKIRKKINGKFDVTVIEESTTTSFQRTLTELKTQAETDFRNHYRRAVEIIEEVWGV